MEQYGQISSKIRYVKKLNQNEGVRDRCMTAFTDIPQNINYSIMAKSLRIGNGKGRFTKSTSSFLYVYDLLGMCENLQDTIISLNYM